MKIKCKALNYKQQISDVCEKTLNKLFANQYKWTITSDHWITSIQRITDHIEDKFCFLKSKKIASEC